ncbi:MAG: response regulator transcription factor [Anaerolineae bacterium]|nr:response regulator transcription factor [Promineifilum sp.]MCZ2113297.1 response regulator transcription factor [Anaerolineae bacterium]
MDEKIRVLLVDDHAIVRQGLIALLEMRPEIEVIGEAADGVEAVEQALLLEPDVILMDLKMPRKNGIDATRDIIKQRPDARILILSSFNDDVQIVESISAGALGYLLKDAKLTELVAGIRGVYARKMPLDPIVARQLMVNLSRQQAKPRLAELLTPRELEILPLIVRGMSNREIGERLNIATRTVGTHIGNMIHKGQVENRVQLSMLAVQQGLATLSPNE